jgi:DNA-binding response OmpR family regulator
MNILIVEDEVLIARMIKKICQNIPAVNTLDIVLDYDAAIHKATSGIYDLFITDIFLGKEKYNGLNFCEKLRALNIETPIMIITSIYSLEYLEKAFSLGVNDYIMKPFHPKELELRIHRWLKGSVSKSSTRVVYDNLSYDPNLHEFYFEDKKIELTKREKALLLIFLRHSEKLIPTHLMKEKFWGDMSEKNRNIRSNIQSLRKSLGNSCANWIQTVRGEGYILKKDNY